MYVFRRNEVEISHLMESFILLLMVTICFIKAEDNLAWKVEKKALQYGDDLRLFCQVKNCCKKSAGWGKWTFDDQLITIFIDVKNLHNDGSLKYSGGTNKTGFFLIIRNITKGDLNISYSCIYGFQVSEKQMVLVEDAILIKTEIIPDVTNNKQGFLKKFSSLILIFAVIGAVAVVIVVGIICVNLRQKFRNNSNKGQLADGLEISQMELPLSETEGLMLEHVKGKEKDRGIAKKPNSGYRRRRNTNSCSLQH